MSKMSKTIAVLGVVAGLGVAALPLSTYAVDPIEIGPVPGGDPLATSGADGKVPVQLEIEETLSMYITNEEGTEQFTSPVVLNQDTDNKAHYESDPIAVKVESRNKEGYHLEMYGETGLQGVTGNVLRNDNGTEIESGDLTGGGSEWGYKILKGAEGATLDATWQVVAPQADQAKVIDELGEAGVQTTKITFGANVADGQEAGIYKGGVVITATAGPKA